MIIHNSILPLTFNSMFWTNMVNDIVFLETKSCPKLFHFHQPQPDQLLFRRQNVKVQVRWWFDIVEIVFHTIIMWHFHCHVWVCLYCLGEMLLVFPHFIMATIVHAECGIGSRWQNEGLMILYVLVGTFGFWCFYFWILYVLVGTFG